MFKVAGDYFKNVDIFARVLHAIFLGATYLPPDQFELNLDYHVFERLSNPALIDYDNPSNMFFMKSAANIYKNYWKELDDLPAYDRLARNIKKSSKYKKTDFLQRVNPDNPVAPSMSDVVKSAFNQKERRFTPSMVHLELLGANPVKRINKVLTAKNQNRYLALVTTKEGKAEAEKLIASVENQEFITYLIVYGVDPYIEKRYDLFGIMEIGLNNLSDMLRLHRNNTERKRKEAYKILTEYIASHPPVAGTLEGDALLDLQIVAKAMIDWYKVNTF